MLTTTISCSGDLEAEIGGYAAAARQSDRLAAVNGSVARLVNAAPDEIALTENATVAWQMAFYALPFLTGDRILTAEAEYAANYVAYIRIAKRTGAIIDIVPSDLSGEIDVWRTLPGDEFVLPASLRG